MRSRQSEHETKLFVTFPRLLCEYAQNMFTQTLKQTIIFFATECQYAIERNSPISSVAIFERSCEHLNREKQQMADWLQRGVTDITSAMVQCKNKTPAVKHIHVL